MYDIAGNSHKGKVRNHNEDAFLIMLNQEGNWIEYNNTSTDCSDILFVVADGMGGTNAGEVASNLAITDIKNNILKNKELPNKIETIREFLKTLILSAHKKIVSEAKKNTATQGMGTTIMLGLISNNILCISWSGDSRCYHYKNGKNTSLHPFSDDHSLVWDRVLQGEITPEEARTSNESNLILQSLGDENQVPLPGFKWIKLEKNDRILACSDGLNSMLSDVGIFQLLDYKKSAKETCESLIEASNNAGGHDNITVLIIDIFEDTLNTPEQKEKPNSSPTRKSNPFFKKLIIVFILFGLVVVFGNIFKTDSVWKKSSSQTEAYDTNNFKSNLPNKRASTKSKSSAKIPEIASPQNSSNPDSMLVIKRLKQMLSKIDMERMKIQEHQPGAIEYDKAFYTAHQNDLSNLLNHLDSIENSINNIAIIRDDNSSKIREDANITTAQLTSMENHLSKLHHTVEQLLISTVIDEKID